jgi:hypothetical protein
VILKNLSGRVIRGYALRWICIDQNGATVDGNYYVAHNFDTRQVGGAEIINGASRVLWMSGEIRSSSGTYASSSTNSVASVAPPNTVSKLASYAAITVSLDSVAFDDGKVIGPNEGAAMDMWGAIYSAQHDVGAAALKKSQTSSPDDVVKWLTDQATQAEVHPVGASMHEQLASRSHWYQVYTKLSSDRLLMFVKTSQTAMLAEATRMAGTPTPALVKQ